LRVGVVYARIPEDGEGSVSCPFLARAPGDRAGGGASVFLSNEMAYVSFWLKGIE
jgi:hypothetical protein